MNKQEIFDKATFGLLAQGKKCYDETQGDCLYRDGKGNKCAVGQLIPDEIYDPAIEGMSAWRVYDVLLNEQSPNYLYPSLTNQARKMYDVLKSSGIDPDDRSVLELVSDLQREHDNLPRINHDMFLARFTTHFRSIATKHGLEWKHD